MSGFQVWPTREAVRPYRWVLDIDSDHVAPTRGVHRVRTDGLGVCPACVVAWRTSLGAADPFSWTACTVCGMPLHPAVEDGATVCPSSEPEMVGIHSVQQAP